MRHPLKIVTLLAATALAVLVTVSAASAGPAGPARYIIQLSDSPLASYRGGIGGLEATNPAARGQVKLAPDSAASQAYLNYLAGKQASFLTAAQQAVGHTLAVPYRYRYAFNGLAAVLTEQEAAAVENLAGVRQVEREQTYELHTDAGPAWIGAPSIWSGAAGGGPRGSKGEGVVAGIIDTGVNHDHPSFADVGGDGYDHTNSRGHFYGLCDPVLGQPLCNDKLIGVWDFTGTSPEDDNQHGSHTASTVVGNVLKATLRAPTINVDRDISGVAPHANVITYKACTAAGCLGASTTAAIDQATADAVDVINYSIGGDSRDPWTDSNSLAFLGARDAGIFVAASAGNSGPGAETIGSPSNSPWLTSVAASTHNRKFVNALRAMSGGGAPPADINGASVTSGFGPARIVYAGDYGAPLCGAGPAAPTGEAAINPFTPGTFNGEIVVCDRGTYGRVEKASNVKEGGAGGFVLANDQASGNSLVGDAYPVPGLGISYQDGVALKSWLASGTGHTASIAGTTADLSQTNGDITASFSSRGPDKTVPDVLKPDVTAPGVDILAAVHTTNPLSPPEYGVLSGTSMSGPHTAGAGALMRAIHPTWTPAEIQSALMTTGVTSGVRKEDGVRAADAFDRGGGRVNLATAAKAGLVLDEQGPDYLAADPAEGGDPSTLNGASFADSDCAASCSWTRAVTSSLATSATWTASTTAARGVKLTVSPARFTLAAGAGQTITVTADVSKAAVGNYLFGEIALKAGNAAPAARFPVAVLPGGTPQPVDIESTGTSGLSTVSFTSKIAIKKLTTQVFGLTEGRVSNRQVTQDPTPTLPYDGAGGTFHTVLAVPDGAMFLTADIKSTSANDLDLFVGLDSDGDGAPDETEEVCRSASETALESCRLKAPQGGVYWIMVQDWLTGKGLDDVELVTSVIPGTSAGNLTVSGPATAAAGQPFDLTLNWNEPKLEPGDTWFSLVTIGSEAKFPGNAGSLLVKLTRPS